nr:hypothetical protein [Escherichia coli]
MADLLNIGLPDNATSYTLRDIIEALPKDSNSAWKLTSNAMSMMADMQATRRRWEELNTERKEAMSHAASLKKSSPFSSGFSRIPLMQWAAPEYRSEQGKIQSLSQQMENYDSITGRWRNRTFPRVRWHLKNSGSSGGNPALQLSEPSCLNVKRNCAGRNRKILNVVARSSSGKMTMPLWIQGC